MMSRKLVKTAIVGAVTVGTLASLRVNEYDFGAIGIVRLGRAAFTVLDIGSYYKKELYGTKFDVDTAEYQIVKSKAHQYGASKLLELCCANKGVYIKVGQHIGALDYLLPPEYVSRMKVLHNSAPQSSFSDVLTVIKEDLKKDPYEIFESIDEKPLGTASLAQVHKAVLKDGTPVAVKVQHRSVKSNSYIDIKTMASLVKVTSWAFPDFKFQWLVNETKKNIPRELDFTQEGKNAEKVHRLFSQYSWLKIPKIFWSLSSTRVLTMEYMEGGQITDVKYMRKHSINPYDVSSKLGQLYSHMIFITGFVHSDPHPGNILVRRENNETEIILLDHGLYADLSNEFRWAYSKLWLAILDRNRPAMKEHSAKLGVSDLYELLSCMVSGRSWNTVMAGLQRKKYTKTEKELFQKEIPNFLPQITNVLQRVNQHMLLILKTNDLIRSIEYTLNTKSRMSAFMEMSKCCIHSVYGEKRLNCRTRWCNFQVALSENFAIFKLRLYYWYLSIVSFDILSIFKSTGDEYNVR